MKLWRFVFALSLCLAASTSRAIIGLGFQAQLGNPSSAAADPANHAHFAIDRAQYAMDYDDGTRQPNWVSWDLTTGDVGSSGRSNFIVDTTLPAGFYQVLTTDYSGSGYDRGHMCPSADRTITAADNQIVFYMSNMVPQAPDNNQGVWASFETYCRTLASAGNEILIISGPSGFAGSTIASGVAIPGYTWKIAVVVPAGDGAAATRITPSTRVIAIKIPNVSGVRSDPWQNYVTSAAQIENDTGYSFFTALPNATATALRAAVDGQAAAGSPVINSQPTAQTTFVGGSVTFAVTAIGDAPLSYQWFQDDIAIDGATSDTLVINNAAASAAGVYHVVVTNNLGSTTSADASLVLTNVPPSITTSPASATVAAGSNVTFAVSASGSPVLTYQWRKNTAPMSGATSVSLTLTNVQSPADEANYDVVVTNNSGTATSAAATLTVNAAAPTITTQPASRSAVVTGSTSFSVVATGTAPLAYQWRKAGSPLSNNATFSGVNSATLTLSGITSTDAGAYDVVVTNSVSSTTSTSATLTVRPAVGYAGGTYNQNFDTLPSAGTFAFTGSGPFNLDAAQPNGVGASGLTGWSFGRLAGSNANALFAVGTGSGTAGSMYSFGNTAADRALGSLLSGANTSAFGIVLVNNTNFTITQFTVGYRGEQWRWGGGSTNTNRDKLQFEYRIGGTDITTGTFTAATALDFSSVVTSGTSGALDGNVNFANVSATIPIAGWAPGQTLVLRWREFDVSGSDDGLAVDNFTFTTPIIQPTAPVVSATSPANATTSVGVNTPIDITFNQPVTVGNAWFAITSSGAGQVAATVTGGPTTYTLTPPASFPTNDNVTVKILAGQITEQATGTLKLASDYTFSFTTAASTTPVAPTFSAQPVSITRTAGQSASFSVSVTGTAPLTYQWHKNNAPISGNPSASSATLTISAVGAADEASYDCLVTNSAGSALSNAATLTVLVPPSISTAPISQTVLPGGNTSFTVVASGTGPFTYQWRKNGSAIANSGSISGSTAATLTITGAVPTDGASYDVIVTNSVGSVTSAAATLTVNPGQISYAGGTYAQNFDTLPAAGTFVFTGAGPHALPSSNPAAVLGWSFHKAGGNGSNALFNIWSGVTSTQTQGSIYSFGAAGSTDRSLGDLLSGTTQSNWGAVFVNNTGATLTRISIGFTAEQWRFGLGSTPPDRVSVEYRVGGSDIATGTFTAVPQLEISSPVTSGAARGLDGNANAVAVTATFTVPPWAAGQTLALRWKDNDTGGSDDALAIDNFTFSALPPPAPVVATTTPGNGATGIALGSTIVVTFDAPVITSGNWLSVTSAAHGAVSGTISGGPSSFTFTPVSAFDYSDTLGVTIAAAQVTESTGTVHLASDYAFSFTTIAPTPPAITTQPIAQTATVGDTVSFTVAASGTAPLGYQWRKNGTPIAGNASALTATLALLSIHSVDAGAYDCVVTNIGGTATSDPAALTVNRAAASVVLGALAFIYDGAAHGTTITTVPAGLAATVTYNGVIAPPVNAGAYDVVATIVDADYQGSTNGTLTIAQAPQLITFPTLANRTYGDAPFAVSATSSSTLPVSISVVSGPATITGNVVTLTGAGTVTLRASQAGNTNYTAAISINRSFTVAQAGATIALSDLAQVYDGTPKSATVTTIPALAVTVTYDGNAAVPINPGAYTVAATITDPNYTGSTTGTLVISITALVRHAPDISGAIDGSLQIISGESFTLSGNAWVAGDVLVPGTPALRLNGHPTLGGTIDGTGSATPSEYEITLSGNALIRHLVRRTNPIALPALNAPPAPTGTRNVSLTSGSASVGDFATLRNLTLNGNAGNVTIPAGTYGVFTVNGSNNRLVLGVESADVPAIYNLQALALNGASLEVVGPVVLNLAGGTTLSGAIGAAGHPEWLTLNVAAGGVTFSNGIAHANVVAPLGTVTLTGNSSLDGSVIADRLTISGDSELKQP